MLCVAVVQMADTGPVNLQVWTQLSGYKKSWDWDRNLTKDTVPDNQLQLRDDNVNIQRDRESLL